MLQYHRKYDFVKFMCLSNRALFPCLHHLMETRGGLGEFKTVMQIGDAVEGLHRLSSKFSQPGDHDQPLSVKNASVSSTSFIKCFSKTVFIYSSLNAHRPMRARLLS